MAPSPPPRGTEGLRPPGPRGRRLVGNLADYEADRLGFLLGTRSAYGDVVAFDERTTIVHKPELARTLLLDREHALVLEQDFLQRAFTTTRLEAATARRRHLNAGLRERAVAPVAPVVARLVGEELDRAGPAVDPVPVLERALAGAVTHHYFGRVEPEVVTACAALLDTLADVIGNPLVLPGRLSPARHRVARRHATLAGLVRPLVAARLAAPGAAPDLSGAILAAAHPDRDLDGLTGLVVGSLLAAQRVPAAAAAWLLLRVGERPDLRAVLEPEADRLALHLDAGRVDGVEDYPAALAAVLEALRLHPTTWILMREARAAVRVGPYAFEPGHHFLVSPWVLHRDERQWARPFEFDPGRWAGAPPRGVYLPFGHGRHACPGRHLAVLALVVALLTAVHRCEWTRAPGEVRPDPRTTLLPDGLALTFRSRSRGHAP